MESPSSPRRQIIRAEALAWLEAHPADPGTSVVTSLPDVSEMPERSYDDWRTWFVGAARRVIRWVPPSGATIFFQSDVRHQGTWVDKSYLVQRAAEEEKATLLWHTIVCRKPPGTVTYGRATYSHMLCVSRGPRAAIRRGFPDVLADAGFMPSTKSMGAAACVAACRYLLDETETRTVVDPFCGNGTVLAVANALGMDALGVDLNARRCSAARKLTLASAR